jgi:ABC-2 type transport system ATP-binding protein
MIQLQNVTKLYGPVIGVNDVTLSLEPGAYGLLGPNGSGKTTLLNLLTGQLHPTLGTVRVLGECPFNNDRLYRQAGYCPSSEGLYPGVSGFQWVRYLQQLQGMTRAAASAAAERALVLVGMQDAMHRDVSGYSRGMRQRTKFAQAIAHDPPLLILDEPLNGLDPIGRHEITVALREWIQRGKSLLMASHILHEIEAVTQSFLLICHGRLLASGTTAEVRQLLVDLPNEITLRSNAPHELAKRLMEHSAVDSLRLDGDSVVASTRHPSQLLSQLPGWTTDTEIEISEVHSGDESLQALFSMLLKIHRGDL